MLIADLHIHSPYSRATSREITVEGLYRSAQLKGIGLVGSGDITHPAWFSQLTEKLVLNSSGAYCLRPELSRPLDATIPGACRGAVNYLLSGEISCIYKKNDKTRKIHCLVIVPDLEAAARLNRLLDKIGNIKSDGRPILGLDSRDLLEICLTAHPDTIFIPAHIWTPWFSLFGSKSGFDRIEECFADLTPHISALETGLSSDPAMNWRLSALDGYTLVSNSDAHSLETLGREANLLNCAPTFAALRAALKGSPDFIGTIEFFPDEGKYHLDGHRACGVRFTPRQTLAADGICPLCKRPLTVGVLSRVEELADRPPGHTPLHPPQVESLTSLRQTLGQVLGKGSGSKAVNALREKLLNQAGNELHILRHWPLEEAARTGGSLLAEGLKRLRAGQVILEGGYDGLFGTVELFSPQERAEIKGQLRLGNLKASLLSACPDKEAESNTPPAQHPTATRPAALSLDEEQRAAMQYQGGHALVSAGPGAGKSRVLVERVKFLLEYGVEPQSILVITFTRKAAQELQERLQNHKVKISTFHGLGFDLLERPLKVLTEDERLSIIKGLSQRALPPAALSKAISLAKQRCEGLDGLPLAREYEARLRELDALDMDDLVWRAWRGLADGQLESPLFKHILVDEYQDVNPVQVALLQQMASRGDGQVFAIGDPRQAIYGFRGADKRLFARFASDFTPAAAFSLSRNYRSQAHILQLASQLLAPNEANLQPVLAPGDLPQAFSLASPPAEARYIARQVVRICGGLDSRQAERQQPGEKFYPPREIAVLYRLHQQAPLLREALEELGIPVQVAGEQPLAELEGLDFSLQKVSLLTMHAAKGLEFPVVFVCGLECVPYVPPGETQSDEEARLLFVALTRARERLFLSRSRKRMLFGQRLADSPLWQKLQGPHLQMLQPVSRARKARQMELF